MLSKWNSKLCLFLACLSYFSTTTTTTALATPPASRRSLLTNAAAVATAALVQSTVQSPPAFAAVDAPPPSFQAYQVIPDASAALNPTLRDVQNKNLITKLSRVKSGAIWLGEHHNSAKDHALQNDIIRQLHTLRRGGSEMAIGLEQIQMQYQHVLDDYIAGTISLSQLKTGVEWDRTWQWPFENYAPIFETAKEYQLPLLALNVNSQDLELVEVGGLPNLTPALLQQYIPDRRGFAAFATSPSFSTYVDYVIRPSFELHEALGLLEYSMSGEKRSEKTTFRNFFSSRILWDECMASRAFEWTNKGGADGSKNNRLLIGLVGADHVKLEQGIPGRYARQLASSNDASGESVSIILNPTLSDTRPANSVDAMMANNNLIASVDQLTLQLRYVKKGIEGEDRSLPSSTAGVLSLADYLLVN